MVYFGEDVYFLNMQTKIQLNWVGNAKRILGTWFPFSTRYIKMPERGFGGSKTI